MKVATLCANVPLIELQDIFKIHDVGRDGVVALRGATLTVREGEFVALLGRSGSGKSTLLNIIAGLDAPDAGRQLIRGRDVSRLDDDERAELVRLGPQRC